MAIRIDRRSFIVTGSIGLGAFAIPGFAQMPSVQAARGFTHSVASGEPSADSVLLWTRYVPVDEAAVHLRAEIAETADFARIVSGGVQISGPWRDYTAKITVAGLKPGTRYYFRFVAPDGSLSPVGRTKTLPAGLAPSFKAAVFSCSNLPFGYFNAYAHAALRDDIDLAIHLGDYFYEYQTGDYPALKDAVAGRQPLPATEIIHLADYRLRYASYRSDPDLQKLHSLVPMIVQWDDHESANDSWEGGAQNHQPATEGEWNSRRAAAIQAYREWMPVSDEPWKAYEIGTLATLFRTETRVLGRSKQPELAPLLFKPDPAKALAEFRDGSWQDPAATMMGSQQEDWLAHAMRASVKGGTKWQVVGFGTIMGNTETPLGAPSWLAPDADPRAKAYMNAGIAATKAGLPFNFDSWGGYPAARKRFLTSAQKMGANLIVISGDSHNAWAYDLGQDGKPAGVEFAGQGVTSPGFESALGVDPKIVAKALVEQNPELKWCDTSRRGYMAMTITPTKVRNDWIFVDTIKSPTPAASIGHSTTVLRGRNVMA
ncbi:MAG: alkaline phosphatase D family protein [Sphingomonas sp.]|uniref:alkaline phosphatase D family protein n=1 Tax=Sphingomonas sp. TaxID=28214 RepID=UPI0035A8C6A5|nr:alkaline phosphatase D family protein [Sphingomonas sp.]